MRTVHHVHAEDHPWPNAEDQPPTPPLPRHPPQPQHPPHPLRHQLRRTRIVALALLSAVVAFVVVSAMHATRRPSAAQPWVAAPAPALAQVGVTVDSPAPVRVRRRPRRRGAGQRHSAGASRFQPPVAAQGVEVVSRSAAPVPSPEFGFER